MAKTMLPPGWQFKYSAHSCLNLNGKMVSKYRKPIYQYSLWHLVFIKALALKFAGVCVCLCVLVCLCVGHASLTNFVHSITWSCTFHRSFYLAFSQDATSFESQLFLSLMNFFQLLFYSLFFIKLFFSIVYSFFVLSTVFPSIRHFYPIKPRRRRLIIIIVIIFLFVRCWMCIFM